MAIETGRNLLHYRIVEKIGEGGMGVVWKAVDTTLDREVAIKILPDAFAQDPDRLARFEREAKVLASLNHTHIAAVYGLHKEDDLRFLAMELVPGDDLAERIARGAIPVEEAGAIALQIAQALEAAHEQGVIHRDLKPANIKLTPAGEVKVLDFGLAKALEGESTSGGSHPSMSPTLTAGTMAGTLLGTAAYMSPEQARGKPVDKRADIWAFGCVLFEMLTGRRVFDGETVSDALAAALRATPDFDSLPPATPPQMRRIIDRCLEKDAGNRLRDIGEARFALSAAEMGATPERNHLETSRGRPGWIAMTAIGLAGVLLGTALGWSLRTAPTQTRERKLSLAPPVGIEEPRLKPHISPDGRAMAYIADGKLWIQEFDSLTPRPVPGGDGASELAWSPDSSLLAFAVRSKIWHTRPNGEPALVADLPDAIGGGGGLAWDEDNRLVYATGDDNLYTVPASGGKPEVLLEPDLTRERDFHEPVALPGGGILFLVHERDGSVDELHVLRDGKRHLLYTMDGAHIDSAVYSPTGHLIFTEIEVSPGLWAVPVSLSRLEATGEPYRITEKGSQPSASRDGSLLYSNVPGVGQQQLVFVDRDGKPQEKIGSPVTHADNVTLSPDETKFAVCIIEPQGDSIWIYDLQRAGARSRISSTGGCGGARGASSWTPDGNGLAIGDITSGKIRLLGIDGVSEEVHLVDGEQPTFTSDGRHLIFSKIDEGGREDLWSVESGGDDNVTPQPWVTGPGRQMSPRASPRDPLVAYVADDNGRNEIYLRAFPDSGSAWQVSVAGGSFPRWTSDGKRLYFLRDEMVVMEVVVDVGPGPTVRLSDPQEVFAGETHQLEPSHGWDVVGTGERFVTVEVSDVDVTGRDLTLITDWAP